MEGRCSKCGVPLPHGSTDSICASCQAAAAPGASADFLRCAKCGRKLSSPDEVCDHVAVNAANPESGATGEPPSYFVWAVLLALFCCTPLAIPAIVYAVQVDLKHKHGDVKGAWEASRKAGFWCLTAFIAPLFLFLLFAILNLLDKLR